MSKEAFEEISTLLEKATLNIKISEGEMKTIRDLSKKLSFEEKARLLTNCSNGKESTLCDFGGLFKSIIRINNQYTEKNKKRPVAFIEFTDGFNSIVEVIDIFESIRSDARLIGHPVIIFAIDHWQKLVIWKKYNKQNPLSKDALKDAEKNLKAIGTALLKGARSQAVSKEVTFELISKTFLHQGNQSTLRLF